MPAKDIFHDTVRLALEKDGWLITDDPLYIKVGGTEMYMEKLNYPELVQKIINVHATNLKDDETEVQLVFDRERDHYLLMLVGWHNQRREYGSLIHIDIKDDKIWIQSDGTEVGLANELVEAGVPQQDIVLGFKSPFNRQFTEYAVC